MSNHPNDDIPMPMTTFPAHRPPLARALALGLGLAAALGLATAAPAPGGETMPAARQAMAEGEYAAAARDFAEAVRLRPGDAGALNNLAVARAAQGDYQGALALLLRARKAAPARADIGHNLAMLQAWARHYSGNAPGASRPGVVSAEPPPLWGEAQPAPGNQACAGAACK